MAGQYGPVLGAPNGLTGNSFEAEHALSAGAALLVMFGWLATLFWAGSTLLRRRDLV